MKDADRQTRSHLMRLFEQQRRQPRHDLGQNFLIDLNLHELIVRHAGLSTADVVLEVGTGTGGLTSHLAHHAGHVISVEFDEHVFSHAQHHLAGRSNVTLIHGDALANKSTIAPEVIAEIRRALIRVRKAERIAFPGIDADATEADNPWVPQAAETTLKLVANLPYNIATPLMSNLVASDLPWSRMVVTIQLELAERMLAKPGTSDYSALTVWLQAQAELKLIRKLPPTVFWPPPKVDSAVLLLDRWQAGQDKLADREFFQQFLRQVFTQRRKQLSGVIRRDWLPHQSLSDLEALLAKHGLSKGCRVEQVDVATLVALTASVQKLISAASANP
ncbi:MAG: rRNA adenine dimethyltransferase family protein [Planctomycetaceae bacterium]|nr:rRNA adenine dimethyltransferase family protein [Planctomycetaceae bacterium]